ncbi:MAG: pyridoxal 5'-phosphate synthase glutaminase subunit PdxT [Ardenticatenaceae bacterium]
MDDSLTIGVLAIQGDFREHIAILKRLGHKTVEVRLPKHLDGLDGLIIPGGESTAIGKLAVEYGLLEPLRDSGGAGFPIWGTCAGMVMLANEVGRQQPLLALLPMSIARNGFGRQVKSFEIDLDVPALGDPPFRGVFIRAPRIDTLGEGVEVLVTLPEGVPVAVQQDNLLATAFHPELTDDTRWHEYFVQMIQLNNNDN